MSRAIAKNPFSFLLLDLSWPDENLKFTIILFVVEVEEDLLLGQVCKKKNTSIKSPSKIKLKSNHHFSKKYVSIIRKMYLKWQFYRKNHPCQSYYLFI